MPETEATHDAFRRKIFGTRVYRSRQCAGGGVVSGNGVVAAGLSPAGAGGAAFTGASTGAFIGAATIGAAGASSSARRARAVADASSRASRKDTTLEDGACGARDSKI